MNLYEENVTSLPLLPRDEVYGPVYLDHPVYAGFGPAGGGLAGQLEGVALLHRHGDRGLLLEVV